MNQLHHANIVLGRGNNRDLVFKMLERDLNFNPHQNPDFLFLSSESFGIDEARDLEKWAIGKPLIGEVKVALLATGAMTFEAQNALLKVLEEPTPGTYFFITLESLGNILPTFLSRVRVLDFSKNDLSDDVALTFLRSNIGAKLALIRSLAKSENKTDIKNLIKNLEMVAYINKTTHHDMQNILKAKICASARGSSPKMLLEWLACVL